MRASGHSARTRTRALVKARVRAVGREFRRGLLAPRWIPQSSNAERDNGLGRLVRIGCSRPAALLNRMSFFFASGFANFGSFDRFWSALLGILAHRMLGAPYF